MATMLNVSASTASAVLKKTKLSASERSKPRQSEHLWVGTDFYAPTRETGDAEFSLLWPLAEYKSRHGVVTPASMLWWLASYKHPDADHSNFHFLGGSKMALGRRMTSPRGSVFEFNPIIPLYRHRHETERGTSCDLFGGLVGTYIAKQQTHIKLFWLSL